MTTERIEQYPQSPDEIARLAGKNIYDTKVGMLRRAELWRLGNAWGLKFPMGASKDYMLPFFKQLEAEGKNPLRPPVGSLDEVVHAKEVTHSAESHVQPDPPPETVPEVGTPTGLVSQKEAISALVESAPKTEFEVKLEAMHMGQLKKLCKLRGIKQHPKDRKQDLVARVVAAAEGNDLVQDTSQRSE